MIDRYEIKNNDLYIYLNMNYEFSDEFDRNDNVDINKITMDFIKTNNINFKGNNIYYVIDNVIVKKGKVNNSYNLDTHYNPSNFNIRIKINENTFNNISLYDYLLGILFSYYEYSLHDEVLKCICILYNTYAYKCMKEKNYIDCFNDFYTYKDLNFYKNEYNNFLDIVDEFDKIINSVSCMYLSYNNQYVLPFIHYSNSGKTLSNNRYPFLSSVDSLWDICSKKYITIKDFSYNLFNKMMSTDIDINSNIRFIYKNRSKYILIGNKIFSLYEIKNLLNLISCNFIMIINKDKIRIICKGVGNELGLSLYGANEIANNNGNYYNILKHYFPKCILLRYVKELS